MFECSVRIRDFNLVACGISYFDFAECLADLESTDHISQENGLYSITDKGQKNGSVTEGSLPYSVRVRAERNAASLAVSKSRGRLISTSRTVKHGGGYTVTMSLSDGLATIMLLQMYAPAEKQAQKMEQVFKNRAENIHSVIISELEKE